jgi:serine/threonine protein phosphatase PrpC
MSHRLAQVCSLRVDPKMDEFLILASDGVWDALPSQAAVNFVRRKLSEHGDIQRAALQLVSKAAVGGGYGPASAGSRGAGGASDNATAVIIALAQLREDVHEPEVP